MVGKDNVLITITTAANMGGIEQAKAGLLGLNPAVLGLTVAFAGLVMGGKSMIEISEKHQKAEKDLAQAVAATGGNLTQADAYLQHFIDTNRAYLSDQAEVTAGYGALLRSGIPVAEAQKDLNRALDLAALKNISVGDATQLLIAAEHGRTRGLIDLGISTTKYTDAQGNVINQGKNMALVMAEIDTKTAHGRDTLTQTQQISNRLSNDWQDLANKGGPVLLTALDAVILKVTQIYDWFDRTGKDDKLWATISKRLTDMASWIKQYVIDPLKNANDWLNSLGGRTSAENQAAFDRANAGYGPGGRASGGPVMPGQAYTVGESGPETLVMGNRGGYVVPGARSSGTSVTIQIGTFLGTPSDIDRFANEVARRLGYATGR